MSVPHPAAANGVRASAVAHARAANAGQPLSGRRSQIAKPGKVTDMDLLSSMAGRLSGLEKKLGEQRSSLVEKVSARLRRG
jgi:hypothetical protein